MGSDISRHTFNPNKHYSAVLQQQGRVQVDADWNEQVGINQHRTFTQTKDVIGKCGVPKGSGAFAISPSTNGQDLMIASGRIYVGGYLCELAQELAPVTYLQQPYLPNPDKHVLSPANLLLENGFYLVYLDAWQREVTYLDDPLIQEKALGEADTCTRLQTVWQVKLLNVAPNTTCESDLYNAILNDNTATTGRLAARTNPGAISADPCKFLPGGGYKRIDNQAFRVEIQQGGDRNNASCKWSKDNASVVTKIQNIQISGNNGTIIVESLGKDDILNFANGHWVEIVDDESILKGTPRPLLQITSVTVATREIEVVFSGTPVQFNPDTNFKLRRWDQSGSVDENGVPMNGNWIDLEDGVQVQFEPGNYVPGSYWIIPGRNAIADVEWPVDSANVPIPQAPLGIQHEYCALGLIRVQNNQIQIIDDCRPKFPALTEICAEDICFDSSQCRFTEGTTVQKALEDLCDTRGGNCTINVAPDSNLETVFDQIALNQDAHICFQIGTYTLNAPIRIQGKGHLKITGCGFGSRIVADNAEATLIFDDCASVTVRDLHAQTGRVGFGDKTPEEHLNGALTFLNCNLVNIQNVSLRCGAEAFRAATCLTVRNSFGRDGTVRVQDSEFSAGHLQQGILLVNINRILVENNRLETYARPVTLSGADLIKNPKFRKEVIGMLVSNMQMTTRKDSHNMEWTADGRSIFFNTRPRLAAAWERVIDDNPPPNRTGQAKEMVVYANNLAKRLIADRDFRSQYMEFQNFYTAVLEDRTSVGSLAITVGGQQARSVKVHNNFIEGYLQGIHIGLSHENTRDEPLSSKDIMIRDNSINIRLPFHISKTDRYGIYVGNSDSLYIENNDIRLHRIYETDNQGNLIDVAGHPYIEGIRVWGYFGNRMTITQNHITHAEGNQNRSFNTGIRAQPLNDTDRFKRWIINWNVVPSADRTVWSPGVYAIENTP